MHASDTWTAFLSRLETGAPLALHSCGLVLVPLVDPEPQPLEVFPLRWGIEHGRTRVTEVGEGRVDRVRVDHEGATTLLVLDGEEVVGARQNRVFNASFLVPPGGSAELPVSCVEQHRWQRTSTPFTSSGRTVITAVRTTKLHSVARSAVTRGTYDTDQHEVWRGVSQYLERTQVTSRTASHAEAADTQRTRITELISRVRLVPGQVGVAAVTADGGFTLDAFGAPGILNRSFSVVASGLLADTEPGDTHPRADEIVRDGLAALARTTPMCRPAPGLGYSLHAITGWYAAGAVMHDARIYHLLAGTQR